MKGVSKGGAIRISHNEGTGGRCELKLERDNYTKSISGS